MSNNGIGGVRDSLTMRLAEAERDRLHRRVAPIVDCIRKMRAEGLADNEIAGLFRQKAVVRQFEFKRRARLRRPSSLRLATAPAAWRYSPRRAADHAPCR